MTAFDKQNGVALILALFVLVAAGSALLLQNLNEAVRRRGGGNHDETTTRALALAKQALIGYAVAYPERSGAAEKGPGRLPCPDFKPPLGNADPCALASGTETGLLPWSTLELKALHDLSDAPLWYAVSDDHRASLSNIVNYLTPGRLRVDNQTDIVAVIVAPGEPLNDQVRDRSDLAAWYKTHNFLESDNASRGDGRFVTHANGAFNDRLVTITRAELAAATGARVLQEVAVALKRYHRDPDGDDNNGNDPDCPAQLSDCDDGFPWLSPISDPSTSRFVGTVGTRFGHLALQQENVEFTAHFSFAWRATSGGTLTQELASPPSETCMRTLACTFTVTGIGGNLTIAAPASGAAVVPWSAGICHWGAGTLLICRTRWHYDDPATGSRFERRYEFRFDGFYFTITPPTSARRRMHTLVFRNPRRLTANESLYIHASDYVTSPTTGTTLLGTATLALGGGDQLQQFAIANIPFDLEVDRDPIPAIDPPTRRSPGELPRWLIAEKWHEQILVAYARADEPGATQLQCAAASAVPCLSVQWRQSRFSPELTLRHARALVALAGPALPGQSRPHAGLNNYFEQENAIFDNTFRKAPQTASFNDQLHIVTFSD